MILHKKYTIKKLYYILLGSRCAGPSTDPRFAGLPATAAGRDNLRRLRRQRLPIGLTGWPADSVVGRELRLQL